jgi:hypothetical protein
MYNMSWQGRAFSNNGLQVMFCCANANRHGTCEDVVLCRGCQFDNVMFQTGVGVSGTSQSHGFFGRNIQHSPGSNRKKSCRPWVPQNWIHFRPTAQYQVATTQSLAKKLVPYATGALIPFPTSLCSVQRDNPCHRKSRLW